MDIVYLDSLLLINLLTDYLICLVTARICALPLRRLRYLSAAVIGASYSAAVYLPELSFLRGGLSRLAFGLLLSAVCFAGEAHFIRCTAVFFAVSAAFGGAVTALTGGYIDMKLLIIVFTLCYVLISAVFRGRAALPDKKRCRVTMDLLGRHSEFYALYDTGNSLRDTVSGEKVMLISSHVAETLIPQYETLKHCDAVSFVENSRQFPELQGKFRLIPCSTAGGSTLLPLFRPDRLTADGEEAQLLAAISPAINDDGFEAII